MLVVWWWCRTKLKYCAEKFLTSSLTAMSDPQNPPPSEIDKSKVKVSLGSGKPHFPNPPESTIPDPATLREQWRFATRQYSRWYSQAWGGAILAGVSFFALGWFIKGGNPLPSFNPSHHHSNSKGKAD